MDKDFPRRNNRDLCTPAELAIFNAMDEVEKAGADTRLTDAIILLQQAKEKVADYEDGVSPFHETNQLIDKFMKENQLDPMHLEFYLEEKCNIICRDKEEIDRFEN